ncbi:MAG: flagellar biosynthesis protein FlhA [Bdellovibrionales bacterium]|nr:flagellar biosynthesis protein FlhA [Bdellovibrionales bacterium]
MDGLYTFLKRFQKYTKNADLMMAVALLAVLGVMIIPLPPILLDLALTISISLSLMILLVSLYTEKTLDFSAFPTLLLLTTLFRLALNVASTRLILAEGHQGPQAAGAVIHAFGNFVIGNNYVIGLIVFVILVVINFVVITKGSGRIAEVAARFTLDAMPGKQMSIDADLNAGLINENDARKRRKEIEAEADFYGSMDGASKFVRGDAIAGIIITIVNIIGGLLIGVLQRGLDVGTAAEYYTKLTIGDGLVAQIPALIVSTAAGAIVTKNSSGKNMGDEVARQLFLNPKAVGIVSGILISLGLVPGLPGVPFFLLGGIIGLIAWFTRKFQEETKTDEETKNREQALRPEKEKIENLLPVDLLEMEVGYGLISVVESKESGDLLERIVSIRKQFALDLGIVVPSVHIRDNLQLGAGQYRMLIKGVEVAKGDLVPDALLAMDPGSVKNPIAGSPTKEPAFGLDALWISHSQREEADFAGYTVVDLPTVMATHLTEVIRTHAHELLGRQEGSMLVENFKKTHPKVVEELIPEQMSLGSVVRVLQNLLREQVSIRDLLTVFETLADEAPKSKDLEALTESVRRRLAPRISRKLKDEDGLVRVMNLDSQYEEAVAGALLQTDQGVQLVMDPQLAQSMISEMARMIENHPEFAAQPVLLTNSTIRRHIRKLTERFIPQLIVLAHNELTSDTRIQSVGTVEMRYAS